MKNYDKNKKSSYVKYGKLNSLYGRPMSQKLSVNNFEWIEDTFQFNEYFLKSRKKESDEGYILNVNNVIKTIWS